MDSPELQLFATLELLLLPNKSRSSSSTVFRLVVDQDGVGQADPDNENGSNEVEL